MQLRVKRLSDKATLPKRAHPGDAGYDLCSATNAIVPAHGKACIPTNLAFAIPEGYYGRISPRSGLAKNKHMDVGGGTIDSNYRGDVGVILFNHSADDFKVETGMNIAQIIFQKVELPILQEVDELDATDRGDNGFGSTDSSAKKQKTFNESADGVAASDTF